MKKGIGITKRRNPRIAEILDAIDADTIKGVDSLVHKMQTIGRYVFFVQQSKSKIDELKYANINLIENRELKNKVLLYQDSKLTFLMDQERRYQQNEEDVRKFFNDRYEGIDLDNIKDDKAFYEIAKRKYNSNYSMMQNYKSILIELEEINDLIIQESEKCKTEKG